MPRRRSAKRSTHRRTAKRSVRRSAKRSTRRRSARRSACRGWKWPWTFGAASVDGRRPPVTGGFFVRVDGKKQKKTVVKPISHYKR